MIAGRDFDRIRAVLKFVTGESENVCRLCFDEISSTAIPLEDSTNLIRPYFEGVVNYTDMLLELGVAEEPSLPFVLCPKCADAATEAYLFQRLTKYSNEKWEEFINTINSTLDLAKEARSNAQAMHFVMGEEESCVFTGRLSSAPKSKQAVLTKVKSFLMQRERRKITKTKWPETKNELICQDCGDRFTSKVTLSKHMLTHRRRRYPCRECVKVFKTAWALKDHIERLHAKKKLKCHKCPRMVSSKRLLLLHEDVDHKAAVCKLCFIQFPSKKALKMHLNRHGQYKCMVCEKLFMNRQSFQVHIKSCGKQDKQQKVYCDICNQSYNWKNALRTHLKIVHGFGTAVYTCDWCGKKFDAASRLKYHIVKHTKERNFHCEKCGGMFVTQAALVSHTRLHTGEKPYKCDLCDESFLSASRRMEHKRRKHYGPQKQCPFCSSKFITGNSLMKHVARHRDPNSKLYLGQIDKINEIKDVPTKKTLRIVEIVSCS